MKFINVYSYFTVQNIYSRLSTSHQFNPSNMLSIDNKEPKLLPDHVDWIVVGRIDKFAISVPRNRDQAFCGRPHKE